MKKTPQTASDDKNKQPLIVAPSLSSRIVKMADKIKASRLEFLKAHDLQPGFDDYLLALNSADGLTMGMLTDLVGISPSSTTKIANKLESQGLIRREASRIDSRQNHAFLTDDGKTLVQEILSAYEKLDGILTAKLKTKGIERAFKIMDKLESATNSAGKKPKKAGKKNSKGKKSSPSKNNKNN